MSIFSTPRSWEVRSADSAAGRLVLGTHLPHTLLDVRRVDSIRDLGVLHIASLRRQKVVPLNVYVMQVTRTMELAPDAKSVHVTDRIKNLAGFQRAYGCSQHVRWPRVCTMKQSEDKVPPLSTSVTDCIPL